MNENLNLVEILKDCPKGTKFYSPIYGDVEFVEVRIKNYDGDYPIEIKASDDSIDNFAKDGRTYIDYDGECMLFPSREQRDWSKFKPNKQKFDPKTLKPYDKVLVRDGDEGDWKVQLFSRIIKDEELYPYMCINESYTYCIPCNEDTKHLIGKNHEASEFYRYWED